MLPRHATDVASLVFGIIFAGFAAMWALTESDMIDFDQAWLVGPVILIAAGAIGLITALRPSRPTYVPADASREYPLEDEYTAPDEPESR